MSQDLDKFYHLIEKRMEALEDLNRGIPVVGKLTANGNSVCLILPKAILDAAGWHVGDLVYARMLKVDLEKISVKAEEVILNACTKGEATHE